MRMIRKLEFKHGDSNYDLAAFWKVQPRTIADYVLEAKKRLAAELTNPDAVRGVLSSRLTKVALEGTDKDAVAAAKVLAQLTGVNAPTEYKVGMAQQMTPEQRRARYKELTGMDWPEDKKDDDGTPG